MRDIRIGFSTTNSLISKAIRYFIDSEFSHTFISFYDESLDQCLVLDVQFTTFCMIPYDLFVKENKITHLLKTDTDLSPGIRIVSKWMGSTKYDWKSMSRFVKFLKRFIKQPLEKPLELICSELVVRTLKISDFPNIGDLNPKETSPKDLLEFLLKNNAIICPMEEK